jgi:hypothetical protein
MEDGLDDVGQLQAQAVQPRVHATHLPSALAISESLSLLSAELAAQADTVASIGDLAEESLGLVRRGNRELAAAVARPSRLREAALSVVLGLASLLVFLDWYAP